MVHSQNVSKRYKTSGLQKRLIRQVYKNSSKTFAKNIHILYLWKFAGSVAAKAVNREDKRCRRYRDRDFGISGKSRRYRDR